MTAWSDEQKRDHLENHGNSTMNSMLAILFICLEKKKNPHPFRSHSIEEPRGQKQFVE